MIKTVFQLGAMYLLFDEPLNLVLEPITSPQGFTINIGDKVCSIGSKKRTMFELKEG